MSYHQTYDRNHGRPKMDKLRPDFTTLEGAEKLKAKLELAIAKRWGALPRIEVVRAGLIHRSNEGLQPRFDIRSDMVDGLVKEARS